MELRRFAELFADLTRPVVDDADGVGTRLCDACVELLDVGDAGILLVDDDGAMSCFASSGASPVGVMEDLQFTLGEGPGIDAHASGRPVFAADLAHPSSTQWSAFAPAAVRNGVHGMFSFPLRVGEVRLGALDLSRATAGALTPSAAPRRRGDGRRRDPTAARGAGRCARRGCSGTTSTIAGPCAPRCTRPPG